MASARGLLIAQRSGSRFLTGWWLGSKGEEVKASNPVPGSAVSEHPFCRALLGAHHKTGPDWGRGRLRQQEGSRWEGGGVATSEEALLPLGWVLCHTPRHSGRGRLRESEDSSSSTGVFCFEGARASPGLTVGIARLRGLGQSRQNQPLGSFICIVSIWVSSAVKNLLTWFSTARGFRSNVGESHEVRRESGDPRARA